MARRSTMPPLHRRDVALLAVAVGLTLVLVWAVPRSVQPGDAGEFATIMLRGGVPHPSGYPWMRALGLVARPLLAWGVPPATAAALPCAAAAAVAWVILHPVLTRIASVSVATFVVALMATASVVVVHTCDSEVWGLHLLMSAIVVRVAVSNRNVPAVGMGFVLGLAVSHHLTAALLVPLAVGATWPGRHRGEPRWRWAGRTVLVGLRGLAGAALGLTALATLALGEGGAWRWGDTRTLSGLLHHVTRADYGVLQLSLHEDSVSALAQWTRTAASLGRAMSAGLTRAPLAGVAVLTWLGGWAVTHRPSAVAPGAWRGLLGSIVASVVAFPALHNIDPANPFGAWILERFDLLSLLLLSLPLAAALAGVTRWAAHRRLRWVFAALAVALVGRQLVHTRARGLPADERFVQRYAVDLLRTPTPGTRALIFGTDDHRTFPVLYAQAVLGEGPDVLYIDASLLAHPWYRRRLRRAWPELPDVDKPLRLMSAIWRSPSLAQTPIYLANDFSRPSTTLHRVPEGVAWRVLAPNSLARTPPPGPQQVIARHRAALGRYDPGNTRPRLRPAHPFTADLLAHYNEPTLRLVAALKGAGQPELTRALAAELPTL